MTHEEVYLELAKEREAVTRWWRHQLDDNRRRALKCTRFPMHIWREYTSARKNRYVFFSRVFDKRMKTILTGVAVIRHTSDGLTVYTTWLGDQKLISPMVLTPHFWKRYQERAGVELSGMELVRHYFTHNAHGKDSWKECVIGRSVRWNGEEHRASCVNDGVLLGQIHNDIFVVRTFITYDMTSGPQAQELSERRKEILQDIDMYHWAKSYY